MKSKQKPEGAAIELTDQALLDVFGGADASAQVGGQSPGELVPSAVLTGAASASPLPSTSGSAHAIRFDSHEASGHVFGPSGGHAAPVVPGASPFSGAVSHVGEGAARAVGELTPSAASVAGGHSVAHSAAPYVSSGHGLTPSAAIVTGERAHAVTTSAPSAHGLTPSAVAVGATPHSGEPHSFHEHVKEHVQDIHERFEAAAQEAHDGLHQIIEGASHIAHGVADLLPTRGPIGTGLHIAHEHFHATKKR